MQVTIRLGRNAQRFAAVRLATSKSVAIAAIAVAALPCAALWQRLDSGQAMQLWPGWQNPMAWVAITWSALGPGALVAFLQAQARFCFSTHLCTGRDVGQHACMTDDSWHHAWSPCSDTTGWVSHMHQSVCSQSAHPNPLLQHKHDLPLLSALTCNSCLLRLRKPDKISRLHACVIAFSMHPFALAALCSHLRQQEQ